MCTFYASEGKPEGVVRTMSRYEQGAELSPELENKIVYDIKKK